MPPPLIARDPPGWVRREHVGVAGGRLQRRRHRHAGARRRDVQNDPRCAVVCGPHAGHGVLPIEPILTFLEASTTPRVGDEKLGNGGAGGIRTLGY
jgi:hypothetical protein